MKRETTVLPVHLLKFLPCVLLALSAYFIYTNPSKHIPSTDTSYVWLHSANWTLNAKVDLNGLPILESVKSNNVVNLSYYHNYYTKTGPIAGLILSPFYLLAGTIVNQPFLWERAELQGKVASSLCLCLSSCIIFLTLLNLKLSRSSAIFGQSLFLFLTTNLPIVSQGAWIHAPVLFLFCLACYFGSQKGNTSLVTSAMLFALAVACRPFALLSLPTMLPAFTTIRHQRSSMRFAIVFLLTCFVLFGWQQSLGLRSSYLKELLLCMRATDLLQLPASYISELFSPNHGTCLFYPVIFVIALSQLRPSHNSAPSICAVSFLALTIFGAFWWAGLSPGGVGRLLSDANVGLAIMGACVWQGLSSTKRRLLGLLAINNILVLILYRGIVLTPPATQSYAPVIITKQQFETRWHNAWQVRPYTIELLLQEIRL